MGLADRIRAAHAFERARFAPFVVDGDAVGFVRRDLLRHLRRFADVFAIGDEGIGFAPGLGGCEDRSAAMAHVARALAAEGLLTPWRSETYDIGRRNDGSCHFTLERAAVRFFGLLGHAVHVNGLVMAAGRRSMWIARRSATKAIDPGMLDNIVGGGLASGSSIRATLVKEAWEEAGIPAELAAAARFEGILRIAREVPEGLHAETIYLHDLLLPPEFTPTNQDAEVAEFRLLAFDEAAAALAGDAPFTVDAALVAMDGLARHDALDREWAAALRRLRISSRD